MKTTIILADNGRTIKEETDIACCLLARDYKGWNTYGMNAVLEGGDNMEIKLKRGYSVNVKEEQQSAEEIDFLGSYSKGGYNQTSIVGTNGIAPTVTENHGEVTSILERERVLKSKMELKKDISTVSMGMESTCPFPDSENRRGRCQKGMAQTIMTQGNNGVIDVLKDKYDLDFKCETENYVEWHQDGYLDVESRAYKEEKVAPTTTKPRSKIINNLRIRKLTPKECFRLMGVRDEDIEKIEYMSDARKWHLAGDSIVTNVLMYGVFKDLFED